MPRGEMDEKDKIIKGYDMHVRYLIAYMQAFINHHRDPEFFGLPDLTLATKTWKAANDYNVEIFNKMQAQNE